MLGAWTGSWLFLSWSIRDWTYLPLALIGCYGLLNVKKLNEKAKKNMRPKDFGWALEQLKAGQKVQREGWNGKGMWLALQAGYPDGIPINANTAQATGIPEGTVEKFRPYIMMFDAQNYFVPWLASQTDVLAEDWGTVE